MSFWYLRPDTNFFKCTWLIHKSKQNFPRATHPEFIRFFKSYLNFLKKSPPPPPPRSRGKWSAPNRILSKWTDLVEVHGYRS